MTTCTPLSLSISTVAVSKSGTVAISGSTMTDPVASTRFTGSPKRNRAMSKSWIVMSRKIPPERSR